jgi:superfamily II DNA helicase RecQ
MLKIPNATKLKMSFNRKNLLYEVMIKRPGFEKDLAERISSEWRGQCGIIYCTSKRKCEEVADKFRREFGLSISHYHAGMHKEDRRRIQEDWSEGRTLIIAATVAFGMGERR